MENLSLGLKCLLDQEGHSGMKFLLGEDQESLFSKSKPDKRPTKYSNRKLLISGLGSLICIDIGKCKSTFFYPSLLPSDLPFSFVSDHGFVLTGSCFSHNNKLFIVGGLISGKYRGRLAGTHKSNAPNVHVYEVMINSGKSSPSIPPPTEPSSFTPPVELPPAIESSSSSSSFPSIEEPPSFLFPSIELLTPIESFTSRAVERSSSSSSLPSIAEPPPTESFTTPPIELPPPIEPSSSSPASPPILPLEPVQSSAELELASSFQQLHSPNTLPITVQIGCKVYILTKRYHQRDENAFEVLYLDTGRAEVLPQPLFLDECIDDPLVCECIFVIGTRFYLTTFGAVQKYRHYCFDTETTEWSIYPRVYWCNPPDFFFPTNGKSFKVTGLESEIFLFFEGVSDSSEKLYEAGLFAVLVTANGRPVCYQEVLNDVLIFPPAGWCISASIFDLGDGLICAAAVCEVDYIRFLSFSLFKLVSTSEATDFDSKIDDELGSEYEPKKIDIVKVQVHERYIGQFNHEWWPFEAALLL